MYYLEGSQAILKNALILSQPHVVDGVVRTRKSLHTAYVRYLGTLTGDPDYVHHLSERSSVEGEPGPLFTAERTTIRVLGRIFGNPDPNGSTEYDPAPDEQLRRCREGWQHLGAREVSYTQIASLLTHTVFTVTTSWTGSMSDRKAIGATLVIPGMRWEENDVAEAIVHEFTHTALFLDERVNGHFYAGADEIVLNSAIRKDERTLPAVVHSLLVAVELLSWRQRHCSDDTTFHLHGPTLHLVRKARDSYKSVIDHPDWSRVAKPRISQLVTAAGSRLESL